MNMPGLGRSDDEASEQRSGRCLVVASWELKSHPSLSPSFLFNDSIV